MKAHFKRIITSLLISCCCLAPSLPIEAGVISRDQEIAMGKAAGQQLEAQYGLSQDYRLQEKVERVGKRLAQVCKRKDLEYSFKVLNNNEINALACPGGFIYVFKGLIDYMPSDTELAGVLSHEITHIVDKHTVHSLEKQLWGSILLIGAIAASGGEAIPLLQTAQAAIYSGFSRTDERGADKGGLELCIKAGYNPYSVLITMLKLDDYSRARGYDNNYGVFSSHPEPEERAKRLRAQLTKLNIQPQINIINDDNSEVCEEDWHFPIKHSIGATKAKYRAYMLAGSLWTVRKRGTIIPTHFVVYDNGASADIYYDDIQLYTIYPQDVPNNHTLNSYAALCADSFKTWAKTVNTTSKKKNSK